MRETGGILNWTAHRIRLHVDVGPATMRHPAPPEAGFPHTVTVYVFRGRTDARQQDVVVGEGRAMVFVPQHAILDRDLAVTTAAVLPLHLDSAGETH